jgi:DNA polymerase-4
MSVAKVATSMNKPMGITLVGQKPSEIMEFLAPLKVDALNGVGKKTASRLNLFGITTLGQIQQMSVTELWPIMGRGSSWLLSRASGIDERPLIGNGPRIRKSMSKDRTFMKDVAPSNFHLLHHTIAQMSSRIAKRLQEKHLEFRTVTVKIRYTDYTTIQRSRTLPVSSNDRLFLYRSAKELFEQKRDSRRAVRLLGLKVSNLSESKDELTLVDFL